MRHHYIIYDKNYPKRRKEQRKDVFRRYSDWTIYEKYSITMLRNPTFLKFRFRQIIRCAKLRYKKKHEVEVLYGGFNKLSYWSEAKLLREYETCKALHCKG